MKVEVDLEDLERIIFATAVIKGIENTLANYKRDPFVKPHLEYSSALGNLNAAILAAKRATAETAVAWDGDLDIDEIDFLRKFTSLSPVFEITPEFRRKHSYVDSLMSKGCIQMGQSVTGAVWPGEDRADIRPTTSFSVRITGRGRKKLKDHAG